MSAIGLASAIHQYTFTEEEMNFDLGGCWDGRDKYTVIIIQTGCSKTLWGVCFYHAAWREGYRSIALQEREKEDDCLGCLYTDVC